MSETPDISTTEKALEFVYDLLSGGSPNYFTWTQHAEHPQFLFRTSKPDGEMKNESPAIVHVCRPKALAEAVLEKEPEKTVAHSGYVRDGICTRCKTVAEFDTAIEFNDTFTEDLNRVIEESA
jgi:hypothetical protein